MPPYGRVRANDVTLSTRSTHIAYENATRIERRPWDEMHKTFREDWTCSSGDMFATRQTDTHTHTNRHTHHTTLLAYRGRCSEQERLASCFFVCQRVVFQVLFFFLLLTNIFCVKQSTHENIGLPAYKAVRHRYLRNVVGDNFGRKLMPRNCC